MTEIKLIVTLNVDTDINEEGKTFPLNEVQDSVSEAIREAIEHVGSRGGFNHPLMDDTSIGLDKVEPMLEEDHHA